MGEIRLYRTHLIRRAERPQHRAHERAVRHDRDVLLRPSHHPLQKRVRAARHVVVGLAHRAPQHVLLLRHAREVDAGKRRAIARDVASSIARVLPDMLPAQLARDERQRRADRVRVHRDRGVTGADVLLRVRRDHQRRRRAVGGGFRGGVGVEIVPAQRADRGLERARQRAHDDALDPVEQALAPVRGLRALEVRLERRALLPSFRRERRVEELLGGVLRVILLAVQVVVPLAVPYEVERLRVPQRGDVEPVRGSVLVARGRGRGGGGRHVE